MGFKSWTLRKKPRKKRKQMNTWISYSSRLRKSGGGKSRWSRSVSKTISSSMRRSNERLKRWHSVRKRRWRLRRKTSMKLTTKSWKITWRGKRKRKKTNVKGKRSWRETTRSISSRSSIVQVFSSWSRDLRGIHVQKMKRKWSTARTSSERGRAPSPIPTTTRKAQTHPPETQLNTF